MILQRPAEKRQLDPGPPSVFEEFPQFATDDSRVEIDANLPSTLDRTQTPPIIAAGTVVRRPETRDLTEETFDQYVTPEILQEIAGRASWVFLVIFKDASRSSAANYSAESVSELQNIQYLIDNHTPTPVSNDAPCKWFIECGHVTNSSFRRILSSDIPILIADFQAIYGDVNEPNYAGNILP